ncbi:MAG: MFS transporter [Armatimonadetes bacterium]|nr:MFS transporter [Armatimonadota bacterium]
MAELQVQPNQALWRIPSVLRLLVVALLAETAFAALNLSSMPYYLRVDRGFGEKLIGVVIASFLLSEAIFKGRMGHLADKLGCKKFLILAPCLSVGTSLLTVLLPKGLGAAEPLLMIGLRVIDGVSAAMLWPALFAAMSDRAGDEHRQQGLSLLNSCYFLGIALAFPVAGVFNQIFGSLLRKVSGEYSPSIYLAALLFGACALVAWKSDLPEKAVHVETEESSPGSLIDAFRRIPKFMVMGLVTFIGMGFPMTIIQLFAKDQFDLSQAQFGLFIMPGAIAMGIASAPIAKMGNRLGTEKSVHLGLGLCAAGLCLIALGAFFAPFRTLFVAGLAGLPVGVGFLLAIPAWYASVSEIDCKRRGTNLGAVMAAQGLGAIVGAMLGSTLYEAFKDESVIGRYSPLIGMAITVIVAFGMSLFILRPRVPEKS